MRKVAMAMAVAVLLVGCGSGDSLALTDQQAGTCFNISSTLTLLSDVEPIACSEPHRYQVIGTGDLLGERIGPERPQQAEAACEALSQQTLMGRRLPAGADVIPVFDRRTSGNVRSTLVCVLDRGGMRTGSI